MAAHCAEFDRVLDNLYLGGIFGKFQPALLKEQGITHILTLLDRPLHKEHVSDFTYKFVYALDMEVHNLLPNLEECLEFVEQGRREGTVLVHWPNEGFMEQLQLFEKMECRVDSSNGEYRRYTLSCLSFGMKTGVICNTVN
nr:hypothetical protein BaRGS_016223 [Batillaria attramentaria]